MSKLKICGHRCEEDVLLSSSFGDAIDYLGFIFTSQSKRMVTVQQVSEWLTRYPDLRAKAVGVFMDQDFSFITETIKKTGLEIVQLHGHESPEVCRRLQRESNAEIWKVIHIEKESAPLVQSYMDVVSTVLLDTKVKGQVGGTGQTFNWSIIPSVYEQIQDKCQLMIAGGITAQNAQDLVQKYPFDGFDVASGSETDGRKDHRKIASLIQAKNRKEWT